MNGIEFRRGIRFGDKHIRVSCRSGPLVPTKIGSVGTVAPIGSLRQYRRLVDSLTDYAIFALSKDGLVVSWNAGAQQIFGYREDEVLGRNFEFIFTPEDVRAGRPRFELQASLELGRSGVDGWHQRKDGTRFWSADSLQPLRDADGTVTGFTKIVRDISDVHEQSERLRESEERLRLLVESVSEYALLSIDLGGRITLWNSGAEHIFGHRAADVLGRHYSLIYPSDAIAARIPEAEITTATREGHSESEGWLIRRNGVRFYASDHMTRLKPDDQGNPRGFVKIAHDITVKNDADAKIRKQAFYDALTSLPNRLNFTESLRRTMLEAKREPDSGFAVIYIDLDRFKVVNDSLGHATADGLLVQVARLLERCVRPCDVVARLGGDEFTILLAGNCCAEDAVRVAGRIATALREPIYLDGLEVFTTASMGIAVGSTDYQEPAEVLRDADTAMYEAKARGRARHVLFDLAMHDRAVGVMKLQMDLRRAIDKGQFFVEYQPIVSLEKRCVIGFEALVRWNHPERGIVQPNDFIAEAESIGLIIEIDRFVLNEACRQIAEWQVRGANKMLTVSVNLSSKQFAHESLVGEIRNALSRNKLAPRTLKIEITETVLMERFEAAAETVARIDELGVELYIDDFGTGYSSLSYLARFPLKVLKVDRSFVAQMSTGRSSGELARAIVLLAHNLGLKALAEGIETEAQFLNIRSLGCEYGQGFWFSRPLPAQAAEALIGAILPRERSASQCVPL
jgi:diguanylate cyclase (GGDEF)-like protein/PAS domain S-box-containing protein